MREYFGYWPKGGASVHICHIQLEIFAFKLEAFNDFFLGQCVICAFFISIAVG